MTALDYRQRFYRNHEDTSRWKTFCVKKDSSDLYIRGSQDLSTAASAALAQVRLVLKEYINSNSAFLHSLEPLPCSDSAPPIVRAMSEAGMQAGTGPMAAVAGAIAEEVGRELMTHSSEILVENGGDTWLAVHEPVTLNVFPGNVYFDRGLALRLQPGLSPFSVCTSSGKLGHSISFGKADAVTVVGKDGALADAVATATANRINDVEDIPDAIEWAHAIEGITGVLVIHRDRIGAIGDIELCDAENQ